MSLTPICRDAGGGAPKVFPKSIDFSMISGGVGYYLSRTPRVADDRKKWTFRTLLKHAGIGGTLIGTRPSGSDTTYFQVNVLTSGQIAFGNWTKTLLLTNEKFVDETAHYDIVCQLDAANSTGHIFVNGVECTYAVNNITNIDYPLNNTIEHRIDEGQDGYYSDLYFIGGQLLSPSTFGEFSNVVTGLWVPKKPGSITYGTNGCHLDFADAEDLAKDVSGNGNDWSVNSSPVQTLDTPTSNYVTMNPLEPAEASTTLSNGNLTATVSGASGRSAKSMALPTAGKFNFETTTSAANAGQSAARFNLVQLPAEGGAIAVYYFGDGQVYIDGGSVGTFDAWAADDVLTFAIDFDVSQIIIKLNNIVQTTQIFTTVGPFYLEYTSADGGELTANFGATGFDYTPEADFLPLNTTNLPDPTILKSSTVADLVMRVGTGADSDITDLDMATPDLLLGKSRDSAYVWGLFDTERGDQNALYTNNTQEAFTYPGTAASFLPNGYRWGSDVSFNRLNDNFLDLCLKAGVDQGFEIVTYTGDGVAGRTVAHSLGKAPTFMTVKRLNNTSGNWYVYHAALGATYKLTLTTAAASLSTIWDSTEPTSTEFTLGAQSELNGDGDSFVAYLFTESDIFKAFSYTGNGVVDGPFVNLGGKPLCIPFTKNSSAVSFWLERSNAQSPFNPVNEYLKPNEPDVEATSGADIQFTSQGFKIGNISGSDNGSGNLIVGLAILESTKYSNAY